MNGPIGMIFGTFIFSMPMLGIMKIRSVQMAVGPYLTIESYIEENGEIARAGSVGNFQIATQRSFPEIRLRRDFLCIMLGKYRSVPGTLFPWSSFMQWLYFRTSFCVTKLASILTV